MMRRMLLSLLVVTGADGFSTPSPPAASYALVHRQTPATTLNVSREKTIGETIQTAAAGLGLVCCLLLSSPTIAFGADFAGKDISGQDFSSRDLSGKDFTAAKAVSTNFHNCNLKGSKFAKANLVNADFSGANVQSATFVDATLDGANFKDTSAQRAIFSGSIIDVGSFENSDLSDSLWPSKFRIMVCDMDELKGTNSESGIDTKESVMCTDYTHSS